MPDNKPSQLAQRNVKPHKVPGYASVVLSLKKTGVPPGDATAEQMDFVADLADKYSFGELRVTHEQNLVLADVEQSRTVRGLAAGQIARPGDAEHRPADRHHRLPGRRLLLAGEREVDPDRGRHRRAFRQPRLPARHRRHRTEHLGLHQCLRPPPRRPHRRAGRRQGRQPSGTRCRSAAPRATSRPSARSSARRSRPCRCRKSSSACCTCMCASASKASASSTCPAPGHRAVQGTCVCHADPGRRTGWRRPLCLRSTTKRSSRAAKSSPTTGACCASTKARRRKRRAPGRQGHRAAARLAGAARGLLGSAPNRRLARPDERPKRSRTTSTVRRDRRRLPEIHGRPRLFDRLQPAQAPRLYGRAARDRRRAARPAVPDAALSASTPMRRARTAHPRSAEGPDRVLRNLPGLGRPAAAAVPPRRNATCRWSIPTSAPASEDLETP
jgi:hypothetical protein